MCLINNILGKTEQMKLKTSGKKERINITLSQEKEPKIKQSDTFHTHTHKLCTHVHTCTHTHTHTTHHRITPFTPQKHQTVCSKRWGTPWVHHRSVLCVGMCVRGGVVPLPESGWRGVPPPSSRPHTASWWCASGGRACRWRGSPAEGAGVLALPPPGWTKPLPMRPGHSGLCLREKKMITALICIWQKRKRSPLWSVSDRKENDHHSGPCLTRKKTIIVLVCIWQKRKWSLLWSASACLTEKKTITALTCIWLTTQIYVWQKKKKDHHSHLCLTHCSGLHLTRSSDPCLTERKQSPLWSVSDSPLWSTSDIKKHDHHSNLCLTEKKTIATLICV